MAASRLIRQSRPTESWEPSGEERAAVYVAVNDANGHLYVGYTSRRLRDRINAHFNAAVCGRRSPFCAAIVKHSRHNFTFHVVATAQTIEQALEIERDLIILSKPEYNATIGGDRPHGHKHTPEAREKMRAWRRDHPHHKPRLGMKSPGLGARIVATKIERYGYAKGGPPKGVPRTPEALENMRIGRRNGKVPAITESATRARKENVKAATAALCRPVKCLNDGRIFRSARDADRHYGLEKHSVSAVVNPRAPNKSIRGLRFEYAGGVN